MLYNVKGDYYMYEIMETKFKKNNPYRIYEVGYWLYYFILNIVVDILNAKLKINNFILVITTSLFFILSISLFIYFKIKINYGKKEFKKYGFMKLLKKYVQELNTLITKNLIIILKENNVNSKDKIKVLLDYYIKKEPSNAKPNLASVFVTIASIVVIAYNDVTGVIDLNKLYNIFSSTIVITLVLISIGFIIKSIFFPKESSSLLEELTYVYMNYEEYESMLKKHDTIWFILFKNEKRLLLFINFVIIKIYLERVDTLWKNLVIN